MRKFTSTETLSEPELLRLCGVGERTVTALYRADGSFARCVFGTVTSHASAVEFTCEGEAAEGLFAWSELAAATREAVS